MEATLRFSPRNVLLPVKVPDSFLDGWGSYLSKLCGNRDYQVSAIRTALYFLFGGKYSSIADLVERVYASPTCSQDLKRRYASVDRYKKALQFPDKLAATLDLTTAAGKSYVLWGVAVIAYCQGWVDRILILAPSITIEDGLGEKFNKLVRDEHLSSLIPPGVRAPTIALINGTETFGPHCVCIENVHAVYEKTGSSIRESLEVIKAKTLVLNDEVHHVFSQDGSSKQWKAFLNDDRFGLTHILGVTGTAYIGNDYFNDVIYSYLFADALRDKVIKGVRYVREDEADTEQGQFAKIFKNHELNKATYTEIKKPLTLFVTRDIDTAEALHARFLEFLTEQGIQDAEDKTLLVTSQHQANVPKLKKVDCPDSKVEWIFSVSMLTEGWDVKNVFQIVPHEERAFESKLLIMQVLGRGLRLPELVLAAGHPEVVVFNHYAWWSKIKNLLEEVTETDKRLVSDVLETGNRSQHHFELHRLAQVVTSEKVAKPPTPQEPDFSRGYITLASQLLTADRRTRYEELLTGKVVDRTTTVQKRSYSVAEVVSKILADFKWLDLERKTLKIGQEVYDKSRLPNREELTALIERSMAERYITGDRLSEQNRSIILSEFNKLRKPMPTSRVFRRKETSLERLSTSDMRAESLAVPQLRGGDCYLFHSDEWATDVRDDDTRDLLKELLAAPDYASNVNEVDEERFKTPLDIVFVSHRQELAFLKKLVHKTNAPLMTSWVKSRNTGFYTFKYEREDEFGSFNPDFLMLCASTEARPLNYIVVVEIKEDGDITQMNADKLSYASKYFDKLNAQLAEDKIDTRYVFHMLSPSSFDTFFNDLKSGAVFASRFKSELEVGLEELNREKEKAAPRTGNTLESA